MRFHILVFSALLVIILSASVSMAACANYNYTFDPNNGGFTTSGSTLWSWGAPSNGPGAAHSSPNLWATELSGSYLNNADASIFSPSLDLSSVGGEINLTFWHWYSFESSYDDGIVQASTDGGSSWTQVSPIGGYPYSPSSCYRFATPCYSGGSGGWTNPTFNLTGFSGNTSVIIRWHYATDSSVTYPGWFIDDVVVTSCGGSPPPVVTQLSPPDNKLSLTGSEQFSFNVTDDSSTTMPCYLWIDGSLNMTNASVANGSTSTFDVTGLTNGAHTWDVVCTDENNTNGTSPTRSFTVALGGNISSCLDITTPGSYRLVDDLSGGGIAAGPAVSGESCIRVSTSDVSLDCMGHSMIYAGTYGILTEESNDNPLSNVSVRNCYIQQYYDGLFLYATNDSVFVNNTVNGTNNGFHVEQFSANNLFNNNTASYNWNSGFELYSSSNNTLSGNEIFGNWYGLFLGTDSDYNIVTRNHFDNNRLGFYVYYSDSNQIGNNRINSTNLTNFGGPTSCPLVYSWNGTGYDFVSDFSAAGKLGFQPLIQAGRRPNPKDYSKIESYQLKPKDGRYELRVGEQYDEIAYLDEQRMMTVDHPADVDVFTSMLTSEVDKVYTVSKSPAHPLSCIDENGADCLPAILERDGEYTPKPSGQPKILTMDLGDLSKASEIKLVLTYSLVSGTLNFPTRVIQVRDASGAWVNVSAGSQLRSAGFLQTFVVNLTGKFTNGYEVRLIMPTTVVDYVGVDTTLEAPISINTYHPVSAVLHYRGYSMSTGDAVKKFYYDMPAGPAGYSNPVGNFTKYGDVAPLLAATDDMYAILRHGDEMTVSYPYAAVPAGQGRDFFLYDWAYYKRFDYLDGSSVYPMPFNAMSNYPYPSNESYPSDAPHQAYLSEWNTREFNASGPDIAGGSMPNSFNNTVFNNIITGIEGSYGLYLQEEEDTQLINNTISGVGNGILVESSTGTLIMDNVISDGSATGIFLASSSFSNVTNNTVTGNSGNGISSESSSYDIFSDNSVIGNNNGVSCSGSDSEVFENLLSTGNNNAGFLEYTSHGNASTLIHARIYDNDWEIIQNSYNSVPFNIVDSRLGNDPALNITIKDEVGSGGGGYSMGETYDPGDSSEWPANLSSFESKFLEVYFTGDLGINYTTFIWSPAEAAGYDESTVKLFTWDGESGWEETPNQVTYANHSLYVTGLVATPYQYRVYGLFANQTLTEPGEHGQTLKWLSVDMNTSCSGNTVTVTSKGEPVSGVDIAVDGNHSWISDSDGKAVFNGCGRTVSIHLSKTGYHPSSQGMELVSCGQCAKPECVTDRDCPDTKACSDQRCVPIACKCGWVTLHQCNAYECCSDGDCNGMLCVNHACSKQCVAPSCCTSDSMCADNQNCLTTAGVPANGTYTGSCKDITGQCGQAKGHQFVSYGYECGTEPGCPSCPQGATCTDHKCVSGDLKGPQTGFVGDNAKVQATEGDGVCKLCDIQGTDPVGKPFTGKTGPDGNFELPLTLQGIYKVSLLKDGTVVKTIQINSLPKAVVEDKTKPTATGGTEMFSLLGLLLLLLVIILGVVYWRSTQKPKK